MRGVAMAEATLCAECARLKVAIKAWFAAQNADSRLRPPLVAELRQAAQGKTVREIDRCVAMQADCAAKLRGNWPDKRGAQQGHDDWLMEEVILRRGRAWPL